MDSGLFGLPESLHRPKPWNDRLSGGLLDELQEWNDACDIEHPILGHSNSAAASWRAGPRMSSAGPTPARDRVQWLHSVWLIVSARLRRGRDPGGQTRELALQHRDVRAGKVPDQAEVEVPALTSDDQDPAYPAMMTFRHASVGTSTLNRIASTSRLLLPVAAGTLA